MSDQVLVTAETPCETSTPTLTSTTSTGESSGLPPHFSTKLEYMEWLTRQRDTLRTSLGVEKGKLVAYREAVKAARYRERRKIEAMK